MNAIEWFGYLASVLIALSLTMSSIVKLRWLNLVGAGMFSAYGFMISALPVALLNGYIVLANIYHLFGIFRRPDRFRLVEAGLQDPLVQYWLDFYQPELQGAFPDLRSGAGANACCHLILRNSEPVGLMVGQQSGQTFEVLLDFVFPPYRDFKTGHYLYRQSGFFSARNVTKVIAQSDAPRHRSYLHRMGFRPVPGSPRVFEYSLMKARDVAQ